MKKKDPELIQKHFVELLGTIYPPKYSLTLIAQLHMPDEYLPMVDQLKP